LRRGSSRGRLDHLHHVFVEVIHDGAIRHFTRLESDAARINNGHRRRHLVPIAEEVEFVFVNLLARQRPVGIEHGHLADISFFVVLVDFLAGERGSGNWEILVFDLVALQVVSNYLNDHVFALILATVCAQEFCNFGPDASHGTHQAIARPVTFDCGSYGCGFGGHVGLSTCRRARDHQAKRD
jgi:hypothetical protein